MRFIFAAGDALPMMGVALTSAALISFLVTPLVNQLATRFEAIDHPDPRRVNVRPIPRGGGIAIVLAFVPVAIILTLINERFRIVPSPRVDSPELIALLAGGVLAAVIGALDDAFQLRARWQLAGQVALASVAVGLGVTVDFIANPFGPGLIRFDGLGGAIAAAITILWIVGMINSINFIDGLDGLSSGIGVIAALTLGVISLTAASGAPYVAVLCFALAGALLGFLRWNFHPASIFVGTSGVMFVGYTLALLSIMGVAKVAVAMLVLAVPIIDTFWIIVRRVARKRSPFVPDRGHIHHRLLDVGLSQTQTVLLIYGLCIGLALLSFVLSGGAQLVAFGLFVVMAGLVLVALSRRARAQAGSPVEPTSTPAPTPRQAAPVDGE
ncbi:MAG: undecaprenyl/decaprenyl-phosphate alpha-N-acetylglucosaminyl 1-phosphate transferase [Chloroflexi bacterium]|nr:undecaprenyl/decaprenyl-phosphate alpha-N-acetylglucosaminyl 1-phosphate transferase [Chloroflexota bacterium]